jgi:lauroyl/myristoyl acyltransferase
MNNTRRRIMNNLQIAFGKKFSHQERKKICLFILTEIVYNFTELIYATKISLNKAAEHFTLEGEEILTGILNQGKGAVGVCAHLGNFPLAQGILYNLGYKTNMIVRDTNNFHISCFIQRFSAENGVPSISKWNMKQAVVKSRQWIKKGGILCIYLDQHAGKGVKVDLFGKNIFAPTGAAKLARRLDVPAVGIFTYRLPSGQNMIKIEGPYKLHRSTNPNEDIKKNTAYFLKRVEYYVNRYPEQWFSWLHRRFR